MTGFLDSAVAGVSGPDTGDIGYSLRCRSAASAYLSKTFSTNTGNPFTASLLIKRGSLSTRQFFLSATNGTNNSGIGFDTSDRLIVVNNSGADNASTAVFRDPTSWLHVVLNSNGTTVNAYVNNVLVLTFSASLVFFNTNVAHNIGRLGVSSLYFDGYISRIAFVSGSALTPSSFAYLNTEINEWVTKSQSAVKAVVDAGSTNSFMLDFDDATSLTTLGYDKSSKGNNWTLNNFSLTAGTTYDHMLDVPGNLYPTMSPLDPSIAAAGITLSNGNLTVVTGGAGYNGGHATVPFPTTGKWYCEVETTSYAASNADIGLDFADTTTGNAYPGNPATSYAYRYDGNKGNNGSWVAYGTAMADGNIVGLIYDADNGKLYFSRQGTVQNSGDPVAGTGFAYSGLSGSPRLWLGDLSGALSATYQINFGQRPFTYTPPTGFKALCQANLPTPAILNPEKQFEVVTRTAAGSSGGTISSLLFPPGALWSKSLNNAAGWTQHDEVRGSTLYVSSSSTAVEGAAAQFITAFTSNGYTIGTGDYTTGWTVAEFAWKGGGAPTTDNVAGAGAVPTSGSVKIDGVNMATSLAGSLAVTRLSANTVAGFSVAIFASPASGDFTIAHGLPKAPTLVIAKARNGNTYNWAVFHASVCNNGQFLRLNTTDALQTPGGNVWGAAVPTSTVIGLTATGAVEPSKNCVAFSFTDIPGYSKTGVFVGNANADGPNVHLGFKLKALIYKDITRAGTAWVMWDAVRNTYNVVGEYILPNSTAVQGTLLAFDRTALGFKLRTANIDNNGSGESFIYYAVADVAGKFSLSV